MKVTHALLIAGAFLGGLYLLGSKVGASASAASTLAPAPATKITDLAPAPISSVPTPAVTAVQQAVNAAELPKQVAAVQASQTYIPPSYVVQPATVTTPGIAVVKGVAQQYHVIPQ